MKNLKSKSAFLYPIVLSLLLSSPTSVLAQCPPPNTTPDFEPFEIMNMETAPFSVPQVSNVNNTGAPLQLFNVGTSASTPCTITGQWTPAKGNSSAQGLLEFRANVYGAGYLNSTPPPSPPVSNNYYLLTIYSGGMYISVVNAGQATVLGQTSALPTNQFQLSWTAANPYTFNVVDVTSGVTLLTATDPNNTIPQGAAIYAGSNGMYKGTWSLSVTQQGQQALPPIGNAAIVIPSFAQVNKSNKIQSMASHFGIPTVNCCVDLCTTAMVPPTNFGPNQELGRITCHRSNGTGGVSDDYAVYFYQGQMGIGKTVAGTEYLVKTAAFPNQATLQQGQPLALHIVTQDGTITNPDNTTSPTVTISVYATLLGVSKPYIPAVPANPLVSWTDTGAAAPASTPAGPLPAGAVYPSGYQFGLYTQPKGGQCWDCISLTPQ